jgi:hypothetical protein
MNLQSIDIKPAKDIAKIGIPHSVAHLLSPGETESGWQGPARQHLSEAARRME